MELIAAHIFPGAPIKVCCQERLATVVALLRFCPNAYHFGDASYCPLSLFVKFGLPWQNSPHSIFFFAAFSFYLLELVPRLFHAALGVPWNKVSMQCYFDILASYVKTW